MIEILMAKICFNDGEFEKYIEEHTKVGTVIYASYDEEESSEFERRCFYVTVEPW